MTSTRDKIAVQNIIKEGIPPSARGVALVDYDGTLFAFGELYSDKAPLTGAVDVVQWLKANGYRIVIFTSRLSETWHRAEGWDHEEASAREVTHIKAMLQKYDIPYDLITAEKMPAKVYIDDRAVGFRGNWEQTLQELKSFLELA